MFGYCRILQRMGMTKQEITQKVTESSYTETEDIYGEIYGNMDTLGDDDEVYVICPYYQSLCVTCIISSVCVCVRVRVCACACVRVCVLQIL